MMMPAALGLVVALAGVGWFYFTHVRHAASTAGAAAVPPAPAAHSMALEPFLVNLADGAVAGSSGESSYLRVSMVLRLADPAGDSATKRSNEKEAKSKPGGDSSLAEQTAELRDTALRVLTAQQPEALLDTAGKDELKRQLLAAFAQRNADAKVSEVLFTEFLVQR